MKWFFKRQRSFALEGSMWGFSAISVEEETLSVNGVNWVRGLISNIIHRIFNIIVHFSAKLSS